MTEPVSVITLTDAEEGNAGVPGEMPTRKATVLGQLTEDFRKTVKSKNITLRIPDTDFKVTYDPNLDWDFTKRITKAATDPKSKEVDALTLAMLTLQHAMVSVTYKGQQVTDSSGMTLTVVDESLQSALGAMDASSAIHALYGSDGQILAAHRALLVASGYMTDENDLLDEESPLA